MCNARLAIFGARLRECRLESGYSQEELADAAALDRTYMSLLERGKRNPSLLCILSIADALKLPASSLLTFNYSDN